MENIIFKNQIMNFSSGTATAAKISAKTPPISASSLQNVSSFSLHFPSYSKINLFLILNFCTWFSSSLNSQKALSLQKPRSPWQHALVLQLFSSFNAAKTSASFVGQFLQPKVLPKDAYLKKNKTKNKAKSIRNTFQKWLFNRLSSQYPCLIRRWIKEDLLTFKKTVWCRKNEKKTCNNSRKQEKCGLFINKISLEAHIYHQKEKQVNHFKFMKIVVFKFFH